MPSNLNLDYYYGSEAEQFSFYRVPKTLLTDPRYKSVSISGKVTSPTSRASTGRYACRNTSISLA